MDKKIPLAAVGTGAALLLAFLIFPQSANSSNLDTGRFCVTASSEQGKFASSLVGNCTGDLDGGNPGGETDGGSDGGNPGGVNCDAAEAAESVAILEEKVTQLGKGISTLTLLKNSATAAASQTLSANSAGLSISDVEVTLTGSIDSSAAKDAFCAGGDPLTAVSVSASTSVSLNLAGPMGMQISYGAATATVNGPLSSLTVKASDSKKEGVAGTAETERALSGLVDTLSSTSIEAVRQAVESDLR